MKRVLKWTALALTLSVLALYGSLVGLLKWGEIAARGERPLHPSIYTRTRVPHQLTLIDDGPTSFAKRMDIIERARSTLELEFFIYDLDLSSRLLTRKLIEKARQGVAVRLLVDFSFTVLELQPVYAEFLRRHGIEVRYYNTSAAYRLLASQHRSHRKLLIADDEVAMTGGRNIGDEYFHISTLFNFLDSDIVIEGPVVRNIRETFDMYWNSDLAERPAPTEVDPDHPEAGKAESFVAPAPGDEERFEFIDEHAPRLLNRLRSETCTDLTFATDFPGVAESNRRIFQVLNEVFEEARHEIVGESPYFVLREPSVKILEALAARKVAVTVLTNSLASSDAYYAVAALYGSLGDYAHTALNLYAYDGSAPEALLELPLAGASRWGVHSKRAVVDGRTVVIGTYNVDPRSAVLNSEILVVCRDNAALAKQMLVDLRKRLASAAPVLQNRELDRGVLLRNTPLPYRLKFYLSLPLASALDFLM